jgi:hypothetical protein
MSNDEFNRAVANAVLIDKANRVNVNGQREFPDWKERAQILDAVGVQLRMIPEVEAASSAPHRVLHHLAGNPEEAACRRSRTAAAFRAMGQDRSAIVATEGADSAAAAKAGIVKRVLRSTSVAICVSFAPVSRSPSQ